MPPRRPPPRPFLLVAILGVGLLAACTGHRSHARDVDGPTRASEEAADFLVATANIRRLDYAAGALAMTHASTPELRAYGAQMTRDQTLLLDDLGRVAGVVRVQLPEGLGETDAAQLQTLADRHGGEFDRRFVGMLAANHARDLDAFQEARKSERDPVVRSFAERRIGLIQSHYEDLKALGQAPAPPP